MDNIFDILTKKSGTAGAVPAAKEKRAGDGPQEKDSGWDRVPTKDVVLAWQRNRSPEMTKLVLDRMKPTIDSAMTSFANGSGSMSVKAAKLTLDALRTYKPDFGAEPSTHVFNNLRRLGRLSTRRAAIIPQSEAFMLEARRVKETLARLQDEKGREPSMDELADATGLSRKKIDRLLDQNMVINESATLSQDTFKDTQASSDLTDDDYFEYVYASVGPVDQKIMEWSSGLHGRQVLSNNAIAAKLGISPAAVSQRRNKIQNMMSEVRRLV